eukprot:TRINITY_DN167_c0_g1_i2.p1 TRINITY_DN167_c0_g1~~TRINITY_DN167_c0_g1_i2.p1  ORF type:complete len:461 (+),score=28.36 TRINITY_DN167_c0_g1_i2:76-1383(+)
MQNAALVGVLLLQAVQQARAVPSAAEVAACDAALRRLHPPGGAFRHPRLEMSMTSQDIAEGWAQLARRRRRLLPPAARTVPECANQLRIAYNVQVPAVYQMQQWYQSNMTGHRKLFIVEWKTDLAGTGVFHVPGLQLGEGRSALQLVALEHEVLQGWAFDYIVQLDDDVHFTKGDLDSFEDFLQKWQPAIGLPGHTCETGTSCSYGREPYHTGHFDHIVVAYRYDTHDLLWPFDVRYDPLCSWASQWVQGRLAGTYYPGYVLYDLSTRVGNSLHRKYENANCDLEWCKFSLLAIELLDEKKVLGARCHRPHPWESRCPHGGTIERMNYLLLNASNGTKTATDECALNAAEQMCKAGEARNGTGISFRGPVDEHNDNRCGGVIPYATWPWMSGVIARKATKDRTPAHEMVRQRYQRTISLVTELRAAQKQRAQQTR